MSDGGQQGDSIATRLLQSWHSMAQSRHASTWVSGQPIGDRRTTPVTKLL